MERLTCYFDNETAVPRECCTFDRESNTEPDDCISCGEMCEEKDGDCSECPIQKAFNKLAEYEDLEEKGLLVKLPCKVGDKYFEIVTHFWRERRKCDGCEYFHEGDSLFRDDPCCTYSDKHNDKEPYDCMEVIERVFINMEYILWHMDRGDFGKTVFLTQEEAEQALKEMEEKENVDSSN